VIEDAGVREARRLADVADRAWHEHAGRDAAAGSVPCVQCSVASQRRQLDALCPAGWRLFRERREAAAALTREREAAAAPNPDQAALFDVPPARQCA
jgi:hypothetical protein